MSEVTEPQCPRCSRDTLRVETDGTMYCQCGYYQRPARSTDMCHYCGLPTENHIGPCTPQVKFDRFLYESHERHFWEEVYRAIGPTEEQQKILNMDVVMQAVSRGCHADAALDQWRKRWVK